MILRGAGGNFSAGYDMEEVLEHVKAHAKPHFHSEVIQKIANLPQPVISAVQGHCSTGALELALGRRSHRRLRISAILRRLCALGSDAGLGFEPAAAAPHRHGQGERNDVHLPQLLRSRGARHMHLANFCFPDDRFEAELAALAADILANSWYANQVNKRALIESDGLSLHDAHALELFKNEGLAPDAAQRVAKFFSERKS